MYLQGADAGPALQTNYQPVLRTDDQLLIQVGGSEMEALAPFQFYYMGNQQSMGGQQAMQMLQSISYIIDINGNINFPQLGFVKLAGLTRLQAVELLQSRLSEYVSNPTVHIQVMNFKYSILGQVRSPGLYNCPTERFTILEAIAQAGDLQATGLRKNVLVVREQNGQRIEYRLDLTSKDVYLSPAYYIRQNDVIYVEPNFTANFQGTNVQIFTQLSSTALSLILTVFTLISLSK